jgi:Family of unknown function (DUF6488)
MRKIATTLLLSTLLCAMPALAGDGHEHGPGGSHSHGPITSDAAIKKAERQVKAIVARGKLDKSWRDVQSAGAAQKDFGNGPEWIVTFKNDTVSDPAKQTLYVFYTLNGAYVASNFTGN